MNLQEYRQYYAELNNEIALAKNKFEYELLATKDEFYKLYRDKQEADRQWFAANVDFFIKHQEKFCSSYGLSRIVIDFFNIGFHGGMAGGAAFSTSPFDKIFIKDLLTLWSEGFTYQGYPIVEYAKYSHHGVKIKIRYIKNKRIEEVSTGFIMGKNPLELPDEFMKKFKGTNLSAKYPDWKIYKTVDVVRNVLNKRNNKF